MTILETKDLRKVYGSGDTEVRALDGVDLTVEKGEFVAVVGTSGSGKSTLLHMLGGLDRPTGGTVTVDGKELSAMRDEELTIFRRRKIGFVFQNYNLVPVLNVYENIVLPIQLDGNAPDKAYVERIIETLGLEAKLQNLPNNLSGGQQQRVAIARALAAKPAIILADEPTGNLDSATSLDVMGLLKVTAQKFSQTIVMITHNEELAQMADRIIRIEDGRIVVRGERHDEGIQRQDHPPSGLAVHEGGQDPQPHRRSRHRPDHGAVHVPLHHRHVHQRRVPAVQLPSGGRLLPRRLQVPDGGTV